MGILNMTPDSFSDGGNHHNMDDVLRHVEAMISSGADIIDVGGESTRPGYSPVEISEEIRRTAGVIEEIKRRFDIPVSIDTVKAPVARAALESGADMVNDVWGLKADPDMAPLIACRGVPCVLTHNREVPAGEGEFLRDVIDADIRSCLDIARSAGIGDDQIILDPGVGFGKTFKQNLMILADPSFMMPSPYPVLLGTSRKSVIGNALDLPVDERVEGTLVTTILAVQAGALFVRVHDVKENHRAVRMYESIMAAAE